MTVNHPLVLGHHELMIYNDHVINHNWPWLSMNKPYSPWISMSKDLLTMINRWEPLLAMVNHHKLAGYVSMMTAFFLSILFVSVVCRKRFHVPSYLRLLAFSGCPWFGNMATISNGIDPGAGFVSMLVSLDQPVSTSMNTSDWLSSHLQLITHSIHSYYVSAGCRWHWSRGARIALSKATHRSCTSSPICCRASLEQTWARSALTQEDCCGLMGITSKRWK